MSGPETRLLCVHRGVKGMETHRPPCRDCAKPETHCRTLCMRCYARRWKAGTLDDLAPMPNICMWSGCDEAQGRNVAGGRMGYCRRHFGWRVSQTRLGVSEAEYEDMINSGARQIGPTGYARILIDGSWVAEHRAVMAEKLGREMRPGESVHHINGVRHDNRPENLELWVSAVRYGQRASDIHCPHCGGCYLVDSS